MRVQFAIEGWTHDTYEDELEIDDEDLEGLTEPEKEKTIEAIVGEAVANVVSWGWEIVNE